MIALNSPSRTRLLTLCTMIITGWACGSAAGYPLDGYESTGIYRLEAQRLIQTDQAAGKKRPPGELLPMDKVNLRLLDHPNF